MMANVYPGFQGGRDATDVMVGTGYALLDGAVGGLVFASLYNAIA